MPTKNSFSFREFFKNAFNKSARKKIIFMTNGDYDLDADSSENLTSIGKKQVAFTAKQLLRKRIKLDAIFYAAQATDTAHTLAAHYKAAQKNTAITRDEFLDTDTGIKAALSTLGKERRVLIIGARSEISHAIQHLTGIYVPTNAAHAIVVRSQSRNWPETANSKTNTIKCQFVPG